MSRLLLVAFLAVSAPAFACGSYGPPPLVETSDDGEFTATAQFGTVWLQEGDDTRHLETRFDTVETLSFTRRKLVVVGWRDGERVVERHNLG